MLRFPRLFGILVLVWGLRGVAESLITQQLFWAGTTVLWLLAGYHLVALRRVRFASLAVLGLSVLELIVRVPNLTGLELLVWVSLIVAVTEGRPYDRALLLRTTVTVIYAFAAVTKVNPSWLAGEGIAGLIERRPQLSVFEFVANSPQLSTVVAVGVIAIESWLAIGLWNRRTRAVTAAIGIIMHSAFVIGASPNLWAAAHLVVFNFGVVACYLAFWANTNPEVGLVVPAGRLVAPR